MKLGDYLKEKTPFLLLYAFLFVLLAVSFALYRLPVLAVIYPMGLGLILVAGYLFLDYRAEKKRFAQLRELERRAQDLRQRLADEQTKAQQRMDYYSVWAHQIKTPIAAMRLQLQGQDSSLSRQMGVELNRIEGYVNMVMTYLRLDGGGTDYVFRQQDLDEIVRGAVRKFSGEFIARKISLCYEPLNQTVLTDEKWLSFVIEQILSNALKYTPAGSISIYMEPSQVLCIRDTGIGIAPEDLPRIFEQGFTGYNGRTDKKASGIGLYLCKRVCDDLGYSISAASQPGKGTVIRLRLQKEPLNGTGRHEMPQGEAQLRKCPLRAEVPLDGR
ncbi:MAG: sensor histidine kinase [Clostridiales bacterium]|nr:sensor histidine kinase [Clostridiales bacterium]